MAPGDGVISFAGGETVMGKYYRYRPQVRGAHAILPP